MSTLQARLLAAHAAGDRPVLVALYAEAAEASTDRDAACFFLTHAYVYALELGDARARDLYARLVAEGREA
jgi:hypothetical protein